ncbi:hypothetical protein DPMN_094673 [Dreissena polymorpha]|uniref:Uncharacterized protein n=1 Tax=Dreissena polymorpha TaxID=45954 RepID=A0A9D4L6G7_DREPO|nr:hypothetical protein DPMN_094673 [Dreissena polymorpha]
MTRTDEYVITPNDSLLAAIFETCPMFAAIEVTLCPFSEHKGVTIFQFFRLKLLANAALILVSNIRVRVI